MFYYLLLKDGRMTTRKELFSRNNEIVTIFSEFGRGKFSGINPVQYTKEGEEPVWANDLWMKARTRVADAIKKQKNASFFVYGKTAIEAAEAAGQTEKANTLREVTQKIDDKAHSILMDKYGILIPLQEEYFTNWTKAKELKAELDNLEMPADEEINTDDLDIDISDL